MTDGQKVYEDIPNIHNPQWGTNQNHNEMPSLFSQRGRPQEDRAVSGDAKVKQHHHHYVHSAESSEHLNCSYDAAIPTLAL